MKPRKTVSIKDIADKSGFSTATVSRVLNRQGGYSEETEKKVLETARDLDYSAGAPTLPNIGILVPDLTNAWFAEVVRTLELKLYQKGFHCCICSTSEDPARERFCFEGLTALKVSAVISFLGSQELVTLSRTSPVPVLFIDRIPEEKDGLLCLESDNYLGGYMATELLLQKGCKKILYIGWNQPTSVSRFRKKGYLDALRDHGIPEDGQMILDIGSPDHEYERARDLVYYSIRKKMDFDGIFASNDLRASGALQALKQSGIDVPGQVKIIGFDDTPACRHCYPALSTVRQDPEAMAEKTADLLFRQLDGNRRLSEHIILPISVVERGTT